MINVSKPNLPDFSEYTDYLKGIWQRNWLTNNGPLVNELELKIKQYLDVKHFLYVNNGTTAIQLALKALNLKGKEIITTPFSFIATTSSIVWEGFKPVFVDIDPETFNLVPKKIEESITSESSAILATHVFGNPCDVERIESIAERYNLKVIYDAAHCFGTKYKGDSLFKYGDVSVTSFHATKLFHTIEGGGIFTKDSELLKVIARMCNFGFNRPEDFDCLGINGKNSEFHAAMGLCNIRIVDSILESRKQLSLGYDFYLKGAIATQRIKDGTDYNCAYYPILLRSEAEVFKVLSSLNGNYIYPRRYFFPSLNNVTYLPYQAVPISEDISRRILCLPLYYGMSIEDVDSISRMVLRTLNN